MDLLQREKEEIIHHPREAALGLGPGLERPRRDGFGRDLLAADLTMAGIGALGSAIGSAFNWTNNQKKEMKIYTNSAIAVQSSMPRDKGLQIKLNNLHGYQKLKLNKYGINWRTIPNQHGRNCVIASKFGNITQANPIFMGFIAPHIKVIEGSGWYGSTPITNREVYLMNDGYFYLNMEFTFSQKCKLKLENGIPIRRQLNHEGNESMYQSQALPPPPTQALPPPQYQAQPRTFYKQATNYLGFTQNEQYYIFEIYNGGDASGAGKKVKKPTTKKTTTKKPTVKKPTTKKTTTKKTTTKKTTTKKTTTKKSTSIKPTTKKTTTKKPTTKKPTVKKATTKKTTTKKTTTKKPAAKKPAVKKPTAKKPTAKKPAVKKPVKKPIKKPVKKVLNTKAKSK